MNDIMYKVVIAKRYKKGIKRLRKSGSFSEGNLRNVLRLLAEGKPLPQKYRDHQLSGVLKNLRECHLEPDLLLIYELSEESLTLFLINIGSHSELFG